MNRLRLSVLWGVLLGLAALLASLNGCGGGSSSSSPTPPSGPTPIQHIVVVFQENRSPDNLFGSNPSFEPGVDIVSPNDAKITCHGTPVSLTSVPMKSCYDVGHGHGNFVNTCDLDPNTHTCKMDGACTVNVFNSCQQKPTNPAYRFVDNSTGTVQPYFDIATWYGFANRMFQTNQGPSFPAHQFIISGTSAPVFYPNHFFDWFVSENAPGIPAQDNTGCTAPVGQYVQVIDPSGSEGTCTAQDGQHCQFPCFDHPTLTDQIDASGGKLTWRYYAPSAGISWNSPTAISHICQPSADRTHCEGSSWNQNVVLDPKQVLTDLGANPSNPQCNLANISWVIPDGKYSDHAQATDGTGPSWVASIVNALGQDPNHCGYWPNTVILITWDDWGGWYDHVPPFSPAGYPNGGGNGKQYVYGFRVPLLVVSAYSPSAGNPGYVSNHNHDFGSILSFMEYVFGLREVNYQFNYPYADHFAPELSEGEPYALADFFNFNQQPRQFHAITAAHDATHFLNDTSPPTDPDDDDDSN